MSLDPLHTKEGGVMSEADVISKSGIPLSSTVADRISSTIDQLGEHSLQSVEQYQSSASRSNSKYRVCMLTPWKQECGNAEYAERLIAALDPFADVHPVDLLNFADEIELRKEKNVKGHFQAVLEQVESTSADVVHIQHEFCFFGRSIQRSNKQLHKVLDAIQQPIVLTLHTWLDNPSPNVKVRFRNLFKLLRSADHNRVLYRALKKCDSIVVHTHETFAQVASSFPLLRKRLRICQIPISPVDSKGIEPSIKKGEGEIWLVLPGFVSRYKGHGHAINALSLLPKEYKLVVAGGRHPKDRAATRYWMSLLADIEKKGLESRVIFTGFLQSGAEQSALLRQADCFLLPYDEVGQSGSAVLADAIAHDKPVITSKARSMYAYRMGQDTTYSSISIDVDNPDQLAVSIIESIERESDVECIQQVHRRAASAGHSSDAIGRLYESIYSDLVRRNS
jgi:glycosyltransferase involved in cell wall biosynthesis